MYQQAAPDQPAAMRAVLGVLSGRLGRFAAERRALGVLLGRAGRARTGVLVALAILRGVAPNLVILASSLLIGSIPAAVRGDLSSPAGHRAVLALGATLASLAFAAMIDTATNLAAATYQPHIVSAAAEVVSGVAQAPGEVAHLDDPAVAGELAALNPHADRSGLYVRLGAMLGELTTARVAGLGAAVILFGFRWWPPLALAAGWVTLNWGFREWARRLQLGFAEGARGPLRRAGYLQSLATDPGFAKELRLFGLGVWPVERFAHVWSTTMTALWQRRRAGTRAVLFGAGALAVCLAAVLAALGLAASHGTLGPGRLAAFGQAVLATAGLGVVGTPELEVVRASTNAARMLNLERRLKPRPPSTTRKQSLAGAPKQELRFERVRFGYPEGSHRVLDELNLVIPAGQSVGIVGENGAGKSTLLKLLVGVRRPDTGRVSVDGVDLAVADRETWWSQIGVIFQDFLHYDLSLADNVGFGRLARRRDQAALSQALAQAGGSQLADRLPAGWETILASGYRGGVELSGGEWQQVTLARALLAVADGAKLLILDEPTANLDVRTEAQLFDRFLELTQGVTSILVSHRLSGVRRADRIVVLAEGRVVEDGNHDQLITLGGRYATMFRLQAQHYELQAGQTDA